MTKDECELSLDEIVSLFEADTYDEYGFLKEGHFVEVDADEFMQIVREMDVSYYEGYDAFYKDDNGNRVDRLCLYDPNMDLFELIDRSS